MGGIMIYDITNPYDVSFVDYFNSRDFTVPVCDEADDDDCEQKSVTNPAAGDLGPEIMHFISSQDRPNQPLLAVSNEISGTTAIYEIVKGRKFKDKDDSIRAFSPVSCCYCDAKGNTWGSEARKATD
jgi:hypothetical protein